MDVFYLYTYSTATWFAIQGAALVISPKIILTMMVDEARHSTDLEVYFSRCFGLALLTLAATTILLTGSIPLNATVSAPVTTDEEDPKAPYAVPTLMLTSILHATSAFYNYTWFTFNGLASFGMAVFGSAGLAAIGLWCLLFASSHGRISRTTGADKRTTGYPFKNLEAEKKKKKSG
ncbi:hypothetical protein FQN54_005758 [Arachnomyces sp. PD_36]|nr:hypothetical protein FQN54_005758 [Arachnomyces sp. PD_36]